MEILKFYYKIHDWLKYHFVNYPKDILFKIKDYDRIQSDYSRVLDFATDSKMSKTNYDLKTIYAVINDTQQESYYSSVKDDINMIIHDGGTIDDIQNYVNEL